MMSKLSCYLALFLGCTCIVFTLAFQTVPADRSQITFPANKIKKSLIASVVGTLICSNSMIQTIPSCIAAPLGIPNDSMSYPVESLTLKPDEKIDVNSARVQTYQKIPGMSSLSFAFIVFIPSVYTFNI